MDSDFRLYQDISFLKYGNAQQQQAYNILSVHQILSKLYTFHPLIVGSIPIAVNIPGSDIDIICNYQETALFRAILLEEFGDYNAFTLQQKEEHIISSFFVDGMKLEIFGQNIPTHEQLAFKHLLIENKLLMIYGKKLRQKVIQLKMLGASTESAFATIFELTGDPNHSLLKIELEANTAII